MLAMSMTVRLRSHEEGVSIAGEQFNESVNLVSVEIKRFVSKTNLWILKSDQICDSTVSDHRIMIARVNGSDTQLHPLWYDTWYGSFHPESVFTQPSKKTRIYLRYLIRDHGNVGTTGVASTTWYDVWNDTISDTVKWCICEPTFKMMFS